MKVRVGVVGVGMIAHMFHLKKYKEHPQVELVAVADQDFTRAKEVAEKYEAQPYGSAKEMFEQSQLDAVSICTFNSSHVELAIQAIEHGLDVLVEKPMATTSDQARLLKQKVDESDRILMVGMSSRFSYKIKALQGKAASGNLGDIYFAKTRFIRSRGVPFGWFTNFNLSGGGPMMDIGVHALDALWWIMGCPQVDQVMGKLYHKIAPYQTEGVGFYEAMSQENKKEGIYDVEDLGVALISFKNGASLTVEASWAINGPEDNSLKMELFGSKGGASLDPFTLFSESNHIPIEHSLQTKENDYYADEIGHFIQCVQSRKQPICDVNQGLEIVKILEAIRISSEQNRVVIFE